MLLHDASRNTAGERRINGRVGPGIDRRLDATGLRTDIQFAAARAEDEYRRLGHAGADVIRRVAGRALRAEAVVTRDRSRVVRSYGGVRAGIHRVLHRTVAKGGEDQGRGGLSRTQIGGRATTTAAREGNGRRRGISRACIRHRHRIQ